MKGLEFLRVLPILVLVLPLFSCKDKGDPVRAALFEVADATERTDADAVLAHISDSFTGPGGEGKEQVAAELKRYFFAYESLGVTLSDIVLEKGRDRARAFFNAELTGNPRQIGGLDGLLPRSSKWKFEVTLVLEGKAWRISTGKWERLK